MKSISARDIMNEGEDHIISDVTVSSKSVALMLRKEDQVWKIDFYSPMKKYIK